MKIRWFPNSWVQIINKQQVIYIDPAWVQKNFNDFPGHVVFAKWPEPMDGLPDPELAKADYILVTHAHKDHYKLETIARLSKKSTVVFGPKKLKKHIPSTNVISSGETIKLDNLEIEVVHAYNTKNGSSTIKQHKKHECNGYVLTLDGTRIYHAGDTDYIPEMSNINNIDVAFLPVGGKFTMDLNEALYAIEAISPKIVVPIHRLDVSSEQISMQQSKINSEIRVLANGESLII